MLRHIARRLLTALPPIGKLLAERDDLRRRLRHLEPTAADREAVRVAREHLLNAPGDGLPDAGQRWQAYADMTRKAAASLGSPLEAIRFAQDPASHNGFEARSKRDLLPALAKGQEDFLSAEFPAFAASLPQWSESEYAIAESTVEYRGRLVSSPMYLLAFFCMSCLDRVRPMSVCEIGGGYGAPARLWLTNPIHRPSQYVIVDLPESLFFAELYLGAHFGTVCYVEDDTTTEQLRAAPIVLCPNGRIDALQALRFDLVINTNSMAEMSEAYVDFFMAWLDRQDCRYFFSSNLSLQDVRDLRESQNTWSPRLSPMWKAKHLKHTPDQNWPSTMGLYEKSGGDIAERQRAAAGRLAELLAGQLDANALTEALDLVRTNRSERAIKTLLEKVAAEYPFTPKECRYLSRLTGSTHI